MLKVELHTHTADDPLDAIPHTTTQLIERAASMGYDALAVTLHDRQLELSPYAAVAAEHGITLIPGVERTIEGKHVLLLNFRRGVEDVRTFDDLAALKRSQPGLVIAAHPYFPGRTCLRGLLERHASLFDAVEYNGMFTSWLNFNIPAVRWAHTHGRPMVGCGDVHRLRQLGMTYSLIDAERDPEAICEAIRAGRVHVRATPRSWTSAVGIMADLKVAEVLPPGFWQEAPAPVLPQRRSTQPSLTCVNDATRSLIGCGALRKPTAFSSRLPAEMVTGPLVDDPVPASSSCGGGGTVATPAISS